jgi:hypothetical protein
MLTTSEIIALVVAIAAFITAVGGVLKIQPWKKSVGTKSTLDSSSAALNYQSLAAKASQEALELTNTMATQRGEFLKEINGLKKRIDDLERELGDIIKKYDKVEDWNRRLCAQIVSMDGTPVPMETKRRQSQGD